MPKRRAHCYAVYLLILGTIEQEMAVFDSTIQKLFEFRASEIIKTDGIQKQAIGNYFYMDSSSGLLVNKDVTSKLAMARLSELKSRLNNSCTKEKESRTMKALEKIGLRMGTKNLAIL